MSKDQIWWNSLSTSFQHIQEIVDELYEENNILVMCKTSVPYCQSLYDNIRRNVGKISAYRSIQFIDCKKNEQPGKTILENVCSEKTRNNYWPGQPYSEYLAEANDSTFDKQFIWVRNILTDNDLSAWIRFSDDYQEKIGLGNGAVFILESIGSHENFVKSDKYHKMDITPKEFEKYVFCMLCTSEKNCSDALKQYIAELSFNLGGGYIDLCGELASAGESLVESPETVYASCCQKLNIMSAKDTKQVDSDILVSQMKHIFPVLEERRQSIIKKYEFNINKILPIQNMIYDIVENPYDLEFSNLLKLYSVGKLVVEPMDVEALNLYRDIRNDLAHNKKIFFASVKSLLI